MDITIKVVKYIIDVPEVENRILLLQQKYGKGCLVDNVSKLELLIQGCGGSGASDLARKLTLVLDTIDFLLTRKDIKDASLLTVKVLQGDKRKNDMGLIDLIIKRAAYVDWTLARYTFPQEHHPTLLKFSSCSMFGKTFPSESQGYDDDIVEDVSWMGTRPPSLKAVTDWLKNIHEGSIDEYIKAAHKAVPTANNVDEYMTAIEDLKLAMNVMDEAYKKEYGCEACYRLDSESHVDSEGGDTLRKFLEYPFWQRLHVASVYDSIPAIFFSMKAFLTMKKDGEVLRKQGC